MRLTVQAGIVKLTHRKKEILDREYDNLQKFLRGDRTVPLYSANKQQALRYYKKVKRKEYPLSLRNDLINLRRAKAFWFLKVPVHGVRGGIKVPVKCMHAYTSKTCHICGCEGERKTQGLFVCPICGEYNADLNGAINIGKKFERVLGYMPLTGAESEPALNHTSSVEASLLVER